MGTNVRQNMITNGLVFYLDAGNRMSYTSGSTTWSDLSGTSAVGTLTNAPTFNSDNQGNISFNGTNQYVTIPNNATLKPSFPLTIGVFAYASATADTYTFTTDDSAITYAGVSIITQTTSNTGYLRFGNNGGIGAGNRKDSSFTCPGSQWVYVMASCTSFTNYNIYVNGINASYTVTGTGPSLVYSSAASVIGRRVQTNSYFTGQVALAQIYNRALSAQEVAQNYNAIKTRYGLS